MNLLLTTLKKILFWSYDRGSWQYDVLCVAILAFVFFAPNRLFHRHQTSPIFISREEIGQLDDTTGEKDLAWYVRAKYGHSTKFSRIEPVLDPSGNIVGYRAWEEKD